MKTASTQLGAVTELRHGRPVIYEGVEVDAPPEDQRTHRAARVWLLEQLARAGVTPARVRAPDADMPSDDRGDQVQLTGEQIARLDELADEWGCTREEAAHRVVEAGLESI